jgi:hypothetical protein
VVAVAAAVAAGQAARAMDAGPAAHHGDIAAIARPRSLKASKQAAPSMKPVKKGRILACHRATLFRWCGVNQRLVAGRNHRRRSGAIIGKTGISVGGRDCLRCCNGRAVSLKVAPPCWPPQLAASSSSPMPLMMVLAASMQRGPTTALLEFFA